MFPIAPIGSISKIAHENPVTGAGKPQPGGEFRSLLDQSVRRVLDAKQDAATAVDQFLSGEQEDPHKLMMAMQRADLTFDLFMQVRNKVVQAYQEVMRMPE